MFPVFVKPRLNNDQNNDRIILLLLTRNKNMFAFFFKSVALSWRESGEGGENVGGW